MSTCQARPKPEATDGLGKGMRIVIANDDRDTLMNLGILLRSEGFEVLLLENGLKAQAAVRTFRPHAVLLDLGGPGGSAYAIANELTREYGKSCPVLIAMAGRASDADGRQAELSGFRHQVARPYDPDKLLTLIASCRPEK